MGKRNNFINIHLSHYVGTKKSSVSRARTGCEKVIAHRTHPPFAYAAEEDGVIEEINKDTKIIRIRYKSGKIIAVSYGDEFTKNGGGGFYCTQNVVVNGFEEKSKVKRGDIIIYNDRFFTPDPYSKQVYWNIGVIRKVAIIDCDATLDDSSVISKRLADDLEFNPVHVRDIVIKKTTTIHKYASVGTLVSSIDPLMIFDQSEIADTTFGTLDPESIELLGKINRQTPRAKFSGKVVQIDAFYKCPFEELSAGIRGIVNVIHKQKNDRYKSAKGSENETSFRADMQMDSMDRIGANDFDNDTVILRYYIQQDKAMGGGDKIEFDSSLKSVNMNVVPQPWDTEDHSVQADALFSGIGINNRIILSAYLSGISNAVLEKAQQDCIDLYFKD